MAMWLASFASVLEDPMPTHIGRLRKYFKEVCVLAGALKRG